MGETALHCPLISHMHPVHLTAGESPPALPFMGVTSTSNNQNKGATAPSHHGQGPRHCNTFSLSPREHPQPRGRVQLHRRLSAAAEPVEEVPTPPCLPISGCHLPTLSGLADGAAAHSTAQTTISIRCCPSAANFYLGHDPTIP